MPQVIIIIQNIVIIVIFVSINVLVLKEISSGSTIFFNIISQAVEFLEKKIIQHKMCFYLSI